MLDCHVAAFLIRPGRVLGRKLRPLTLAHYWLLEASGSPYTTPGAVCGYTDMAFAVFIVSLPVWVARWMIMRPVLLNKAFAAWGRIGRARYRFQDLSEFQAYWDAYTEMPEAYEREGRTGKGSCLPVSVNIAWAIMHKVGELRAWSMPMPLALMYYTAEAECNGTEYVSERSKMMAEMNSGKVDANG